MKANIKLELKTLTPIKLAALLRNVAANLDGNPHFPAPPITATDLKALAVTLGEAITEATEGSRHSKLVRDGHADNARSCLRRTADYVRMVAEGDEVMLASSGFSLCKVSGPAQPMDTPVMRTARMTGRHGEVELRWTGIANRRTYHVYVTDQDPAQEDTRWALTGITGKITHRVQGLEPYRAYWFCVSAVGALGEGCKSGAVCGRAA